MATYPFSVRILLVTISTAVALVIYSECASDVQYEIERAIFRWFSSGVSPAHLLPVLTAAILWTVSAPLGLWVVAYVNQRLSARGRCWRCGGAKRILGRCMACGRFDLRWLKWAGVAYCVLLVAAFLVSGFATVCWTYSDWQFLLTDGAIGVFCPRWVVFSSHVGFEGWSVWVPHYGRNLYTVSLEVPIWPLLVSCLVPTVLLLRADRKRKRPGRCCCGYDLTGNTSGVCPECGLHLEATDALPASVPAGGESG